MGDVIRNFEGKKEEKELAALLDDVMEQLEENMKNDDPKKQSKKEENIINAPFRYRMDLDAIDPLSPEDEELLKFLTEEPPADENVLQRNYRINRLNEFDNLVKELIKFRK